MIQILIAFLFLLFGWFYWINRDKNAPPILKPCWPFLGHVYLLRGSDCDNTDLWETSKRVVKECIENGGVFRVFLGYQTYYVITDPADSLTVGNACDQKHYIYDFGKRWLGDGLVTASGPIWRKHKKLLNPAFSMQVQLGFMNIFNDTNKKLYKVFDAKVGQGPFDLMTVFRALALENIFLAAFGISSLIDDEFFKIYANAADQLMSLVTRRLKNVLYHSDFIYQFTDLKREEEELLNVVTDMAEKIVRKKREMINKGDTEMSENDSESKNKPLLDLLLNLSEGEGDKSLTDKEIREEIDTAITAALDTTALTLTNALVFLGTYEDKQDKIYEEIRQVMGDTDRDVDKYDVTNLKYMEAVIKEALRLHPTGPFTVRTLDKDIQLKKYTLKAGRHCIISSYGMHRSACWGEDVDSFRPERWLETDVPLSAFTAFGVGRRNCPGKSYAMISVKTTLVHFLRRYRVKANANDMKFTIDLILKPVSGHFVELEFRNGIKQ